MGKLNKVISLLLLFIALLVTACAGQEPESEPIDARADSIIGGTPTGLADPEVFALLRSGWPFCSSTLIHPRVLLTAAHCVEDSFSSVTNHPQGYSNGSPYVMAGWAHPNYATTGLAEYDLGLVLLSAPITSVAPKPVQRTSLSAPASGRAVGYGQQSVNSNPISGERFTINLPVIGVTAGQVRYGSPGAAICFGDSGGPFFATINGVETVIAVHSYTNDPTCSGGAGARVDTNMPLLEAFFAANVCPRDGVCDAACLAVDFDCTCGADGQCTAACTRPELDPDCPAHCADDGICAASACPITDVDCRPAGALCERANQCSGQQCRTDAQHPAAYCSMTCTTLADCGALDQGECEQGTCRLKQVPVIAEGVVCQLGDRCADGLRCHALESNRSLCAKPCAGPSDCAEGAECRFGLSSWQACVQKPMPSTPEPSPAAPQGCSTSGALLFSSLAVLLARARRRLAP